MKVRTTITYPNGHSTVKLVDWNNREQVRAFAIIARQALERGAKVTSEAIQ